MRQCINQAQRDAGFPTMAAMIDAKPDSRQWMAGVANTVVGQLLLPLVMLASALPAQADMLADAFRAARRTVAPMASRASLEIVRDTAVTSAMAARFEDGVCRIFVLETSDFLASSLAQLEPALQKPYLEALFAHEFGHCQEQYLVSMDAGARELPAPTLAPVRMHRLPDGGLLLISVRREALWGEILADAYFGMYLNERYPALSQRLIDFRLAQRGGAALVDPEHDTARFLSGLPLQRQSGEFMLDAGQRLRRTATAVERIASNTPGAR